MLNISTESKNLYKQNRLPNVASLAEVHLFVEILDSNTVLTDDQIEQENFELEESICSEDELYFGLCESAMCKFAVYNVSESLIGKRIHVWQTICDNAEVVSLGYFKISEETKRDGNTGLWKDIVAYDYLSEVLDTDALAWWKTFWENQTSRTVHQIWTGLLTHIGITYDTTQTLANDSRSITNNINPSNLSPRNILQACGELSGVFGRMGRDGVFRWIAINGQSGTGGAVGGSETIDGLNPLYFADNSTYEDYTCPVIDSVIIQDYEGALAVKVGTTDNNPYVLFGNFLTWGMTSTEQTAVANALLPLINNVAYVPNRTSMIGLPYMEPGDAVNLALADKTLRVIVLQRVLSGIISLVDQTTTQGYEVRQNKADSTKMSFSLSASDAVTRVLFEKTASEIRSEVSTQITGISGRIDTVEDDVDDIEGDIASIDGRVQVIEDADYVTDVEMNSAIQQSADSINLSVSATYQTKSAMSDYSTTAQMKSAINVAIDGITLAGKTIDMTANDIKIKSDNFNVDKNGNVICKSLTANTNVTVTGTINATGGEITGSTISLKDTTSSGSAKIRVTNTNNTNAYSTMWSNQVQVRTSSTNHTNLNASGVQSTVTVNNVQSYAQYYNQGITLRTGASDDYFIVNSSNLIYGPVSGTANKINLNINRSAGEVYLRSTANTLWGSTFKDGYHSDALTINHCILHDGSGSMCYGIVVNQYNTNGTIHQWVTRIQGSGVTTANVATSSDRRLKEDIYTLPDSYVHTIYRNLSPKSFRFKNDDGGKKRFGLIAQEVQDALAKAGDDWERYNIVSESDGYYYISYSELHAFHISMIKQQERKIDELTSENNRLWAELEIIKQRIENL